MSDKKHGNPVATYIITALILGVITYIEFAIVEYDIAWLSRGAVLFWLVALSIVKFIMVIAIFMHLKDDEKTYTGFFGSGMVLALGTFIILPILFTVASIPEPVVQAQARAQAETGVVEDTESADPTAQLDNPEPLDRSITIEPPAAADADAEVTGEAEAQPETLGGAAQQDDHGGTAVEDAQAGAGGAQADAEDAQQGADDAAGDTTATVEFDRQAGETTYTQVCSGCHQGQGQGLPGVFPPLAQNMPEIYNAGGREYLIDVVIHGLSGQIEVLGTTYNMVMPPQGQLSDDQIAAVLNHELTAWGNEALLTNFEPIAGDEVAGRRDADVGNLAERRAELFAQ